MSTQSNLTQLIINTVESQEVYEYMDANGLTQDNQLYLVEGDDRYTHPAYTKRTSGLYKITVDELGHVSEVTAVTKADITALGIPGQDTTYTHPSYTARTSGMYKITVDSTGHVSAVTAVTKDDITALGIPAQDHTHGSIVLHKADGTEVTQAASERVIHHYEVEVSES